MKLEKDIEIETFGRLGDGGLCSGEGERLLLLDTDPPRRVETIACC